MSGGKGNGHGNGASKSTRAPKRGSEKGAARPDKPDDLPPLRSFHDRLPWLPWALVAVMGVALLALTMNTLDFSRREQLLERRLDIATEESEPPQEQLDALDADGTVSTTTTTSEPPDTGEEALARERALELQRLEAELERQAAVLDQRESDLDEREQALATVPTTVDETDGSFGSGVHLVGVEIPLGAYRAQAQAGCRYQKLAADDEVLFADQRLEAGPVSVDIGAEVHRFDSNGCGTWVPLD